MPNNNEKLEKYENIHTWIKNKNRIIFELDKTGLFRYIVDTLFCLFGIAAWI